MRKIIHEIRQQPHHVRELATALCTVIVVTAVALVWFDSFQKDIYALLNPEEQSQSQDQQFAEESKSLFSSILEVLNDGRAQISSLFGGKNQTDIENSQSSPSMTPNNSVHLLPVSGNR